MSSESSGDTSLQEVLAAYFLEVEAGKAPSPEVWIARHPAFAVELAEFFANQAHFQKAAQPLQGLETVGLASSRPSPRRIRYFGDYELMHEIARGGMGVVYQAKQLSLNRVVALKMILAGELATETDVQRFRTEAEAAAALDHPHIVSIYEVGSHDGHQYFSMKLIEGGSLSKQMPALVRDSRKAATLLAKVARAVHYAHQRGILHRDLKPANILVDRGEPHITDFGLAKKVKQGSDLTRSGAIVGTPSYMAPEQALARKDISTLADVYSLGAILYQMLTGRPPFQGENPMEVLLQVVEKEPMRPRDVDPRVAVDPDLETLCLKCLAKEPERRLRSAEALAEELERWLRGEPILARPVGPVERLLLWRRRNPVIASLTAAVAGLLLVGTIVSSYFAIQASYRADEAKRQQKQAEDNADRARKEQTRADDNAKIADEKAEAARESAFRALAAKRLADQHLYVAHMNLAQQAFELNEPPRALELLEKHQFRPEEEDPRGFEWHYWMHQARQYSNVLQHPAGVQSIAYSSDGQLIATGCQDRTLRFWDAKSHQLLSTHLMSGRGIWHLAFSPDSMHLAVAIIPNVVEIWDVPKRERIAKLPLLNPGQYARQAVFAPDGKTLAISSDDPRIELWDWAAQKRTATLTGHTNSVRGLAFSKDGKRLASCGLDGLIAVWNLDTKKQIASLKGKETLTVAFAPDGQTVVAGAEKGELRIWDFEKSKVVHDLRGHTSAVQDMVLSPDGKILMTGAADRKIILWDTATGKSLRTLHGHTSWVHRLALSPDGDTLASASTDRTVKLWNVPRMLAGDKSVLSASKGYEKIAFSADSSLLASGGMDRIIRIWDVQRGTLIKELVGHKYPVHGLSFTPDGKQLVAGGGPYPKPAELKLWNLQTGEAKELTPKHTYEIRCLQMSANGRWLATGGEDHATEIWDMQAGKSHAFLKGDTDYIFGLAISPDNKTLATGSGEVRTQNALILWDLETGGRLAILPGHTATVNGLSFSRDGHILATGSEDKSIRLWDVASRRQTAILTGHADGVNSVDICADGRSLASASRDGSVKIWNLATGQPTATFKYGTTHPVRAVFAPDGKTLAASYYDGTIRLWRTRMGE